jgi:hypothetical protein
MKLVIAFFYGNFWVSVAEIKPEISWIGILFIEEYVSPTSFSVVLQ